MNSFENKKEMKEINKEEKDKEEKEEEEKNEDNFNEDEIEFFPIEENSDDDICLPKEMYSSDFDEDYSETYIYTQKHFNGDDELVGHHDPHEFKDLGE